MYSVVVHTSDSTADYGTNIKTTVELKEFLCGLDMRLVTHLAINYYRELTGPAIPTAPINIVKPEVEGPDYSKADKAKDWEPDNMGLPL